MGAGGRAGAVATTACPVCGAEFPEEDAEALGAFRETRDGRSYWLDSTTCRDVFRTHGPTGHAH